MREIRGNLWDECFDLFWRCITTNGYIKKNHQAVMGRGCAREAAKRFKNLQSELGTRLNDYGNRLHVFQSYRIVTFPVKYIWYDKADLKLIEISAYELKQLAEASTDKFVLPRPGCGNGQLEWSDVKPIIEILPDNVLIISF